MIIVVMGVAGAGKTTIGEQLAQQLGCEFLDADAFHSAANIQKMSAGIALTDSDRKPWLESLHQALAERVAEKKDAVLACSALKETYRRTLANRIPIRWVYLKVSPETAHQRLRLRTGHYAKENLVSTQFDTLEEPREALVVDASKSAPEIVENILLALRSWDQDPKRA